MLDIETLKKQKGYTIVDDFNDGIARARKNEKWGYINEEGNEIIPCEYDSIQNFENGLCKAKKDEKLFHIDLENNAYYTEKECEIFIITYKEIAKRREINANRIKQCKNEEIEEVLNDYLKQVEYLKKQRDEKIKLERAKQKALKGLNSNFVK